MQLGHRYVYVQVYDFVRIWTLWLDEKDGSRTVDCDIILQGFYNNPFRGESERSTSKHNVTCTLHETSSSARTCLRKLLGQHAVILRVTVWLLRFRHALPPSFATPQVLVHCWQLLGHLSADDLRKDENGPSAGKDQANVE